MPLAHRRGAQHRAGQPVAVHEFADYRFVRRYLERHAPAPLTLRQVDPLIRELTHYRDVIARKTQEANP